MAKKQAGQPTPKVAKNVKRKRAPRRRRGQQGSSGGLMALLFLTIMMVGLFNRNVGLLLVLFMIPTFVLAATGKDQYQSDKLTAVMFMNIAGILPFAAEVWRNSAMFSYVIFDMVKIATMLGAAALGYVLLWVCPIVAAMILQAFGEDKLKTIAAQRKELLELFGPEVLGEPAKPAEPKKKS